MRTINGRPAWTEEPAGLGVNVLAVRGELTWATGERLARRVLALASTGQHAFVVDLATVGAMDARAMIPLLHAARERSRRRNLAPTSHALYLTARERSVIGGSSRRGQPDASVLCRTGSASRQA
jgi:hypothetical protein